LNQDPHARWVKNALKQANLGPVLDQIDDLKDKGDYAAAISIFKKQLAADPENVQLYLAFAKLYKEMGSYPEAIELLNEGLVHYPKEDSLHLALGFTYLAQKNLINAEYHLESVKSNSSRSEALAGLGKVAALKGEVRQAEELYQESILLNPLSSLALTYLAELRMQQRRYQEAEQLYEKIVALEPKAIWAKQALESAKIAPHLDLIAQEQKQNHFEKAEEQYRELLLQFPTNSDLYFRFAQFYRDQKRYQQAVDTAMSGLNVNPNTPYLYVSLGNDYLSLGELDKSQQAFHRVLDHEPRNAAALAGLGRIYAILGDSERANYLYQQALRINPEEITALSSLIDLQMEQKNYEEAKNLLERVLEITPQARWAKESLPRAKYGKDLDEIEALEAAGRLQEASVKLKTLLEEAPESEDIYLALGRIYSKQKRYHDAVNLYQKGLLVDPLSNQLRVHLGLTYIAMNELKLAKKILDVAYQIDPNNAEALAGLGRIAALNGHKTVAQNFYQTALQINPDSVLTLSYLANFLMLEKQFSEAEKVYKKILQIDPKAAWAEKALEDAKYASILLEGKEDEKIKDYADAEAIYLRLIQEHPQQADYYILLGKLYVKMKQYHKAIALYQNGLQNQSNPQALTVALGFAYLANGERELGSNTFKSILDKDPNNAEALAGLGQYEQLTGHTNEALHLYQSALKADPDNITANVYLAKLQFDLGLYDSAQKLYKKIHTLLPSEQWVKLADLDAKHGHLLDEIKKRENAKDFKGAEVLYEQLLREEPHVGEYYLRFGLFYHNVKEYGKAIDAYLRGIKFAPESSELYAALGLVNISLKEYDKATKDFHNALRRDPSNPDALAGLGYIAMMKEKYGDAEKWIKAALTLDPERIAALSAYGDLLMKEKRYPEAQKVYEKLLVLRPKDKWIRLSLDDAIYGTELDKIRALIEENKFSEAAEDYRMLLEKSPDNPRFYYGLGQMLMRLRQYSQSIEINRIGLEKNPDENELRVALGYAYFFNTDLSSAREVLTQALDIDAKNPEALAGLGRVNALDEDFDTAETLYKKALAIDPKNLSAISFYAELLMREGRYNEAEEVLAALRKILPHADWVRRSWQDAVDGQMTHIANVLADKQEFELAANLYRQLIASSPDDPARYLALGQMYVNLQCYCQGIEVFNQGLAIDQEAFYLWRAIAFTYILTEDFAAAQSIFETLLEQDPSDAQSLGGLGRIQALDGSLCLAEEYYAEALEIAPKNLTVLSFLADLQQFEGYNFSAMDTYDWIYAVSEKNLLDSDPLPKWVVKGYNTALNLSCPTVNVEGFYHEEEQWDPIDHRWSAEYLVYGGKGLLNYPLNDRLNLWGSVVDQFYVLKDLIAETHIYSFDVQRFHVGARWIYNPSFFIDGKIGLSNFSPYSKSTFKMKTGTFAEPSLILTYHNPIEKATLSFITNSDLIARNFNTNVAEVVFYYTLSSTYERRIIKRGWVGFEATAFWYHDFVRNRSERLAGWFQWRPPCYSDNILFRYFVKYQTFAKNIPDYYTYKPQIINQLQVTLEKSWRVCWADTFYTSLSYGHGWQDTRSRFTQIIVVAPTTVTPPITWDRRQFNIVIGSIIYKYGQLVMTLAADYYRDTEKYTIWNVGGSLGWRF